MEKSISFETCPEELREEIVLRSPLKSLAKLVGVSRKWSSIIRGEDFKARYLSLSKERPRVLLAAAEIIKLLPDSAATEEEEEVWLSVMFRSVYQEEEPLLSSGLQEIRVRVLGATSFRACQPIRGVICLHFTTNEIVIFNPCTGKSQTLPDIQADANHFLVSFFGYDETRDVFKVLCMALDGPFGDRPREAQILTCKGGQESVVMSFNMSSEEFTAVQVPEGVNFRGGWSLVKYKKKIALSRMVDHNNGELQLWVRKATGGWSSERFVIPDWKDTVGNTRFHFKGTVGKSILVFYQVSIVKDSRSTSLLYFDKSTQRLRRYDFQDLYDAPPLKLPYPAVQLFLDHCDSTWLL
ncbi:PREDICTED: putative F-box protein At1g70390 [Camelina sativa]|uniref:F-box protein At1g70390 n=1 Tax=Camelina sativa TaxID=90675 RepID=A0ABM0TU59_CAMSA|nr:PREDICTED: putative F-box protein At1g70390 [Camelina sativa]